MSKNIRETLGELLKEEVFNDDDIIVGNGTKQLKLTEPQNTGTNKLKEFTIVNVPEDTAVFTLDFNHLNKRGEMTDEKGQCAVSGNFICKFLSRIWSNLKPSNCGRSGIFNYNSLIRNFSWLIIDTHKFAAKKCDIVIVNRVNRNLNIVVGEIKSKFINEEKISNQLRNSHLILEYIFDLLKEYHVGNAVKLNYHYVVFTNSANVNNLNEKYQTNQGTSTVTTLFVKVNNHGKLILKP